MIGYGPAGRRLARVLGEAGVPYAVSDLNPESLRQADLDGAQVVFGDAAREPILLSLGAAKAKLLVVAINDRDATKRIVAVARHVNPTLQIFARTRFISDVEVLTKAGADVVVPEELETTVRLFSHVLGAYLVPKEEIERQASLVRQDDYGVLRGSIQEAHLMVLQGLDEEGLHTRAVAVPRGRARRGPDARGSGAPAPTGHHRHGGPSRTRHRRQSCRRLRRPSRRPAGHGGRVRPVRRRPRTCSARRRSRPVSRPRVVLEAARPSSRPAPSPVPRGPPSARPPARELSRGGSRRPGRGSQRPFSPQMALDILSLIGGLVLLVGAAHFLVLGAAALALRFGLSPLVVGLTVVAFGDECARTGRPASRPPSRAPAGSRSATWSGRTSRTSG